MGKPLRIPVTFAPDTEEEELYHFIRTHRNYSGYIKDLVRADKARKEGKVEQAAPQPQIVYIPYPMGAGVVPNVVPNVEQLQQMVGVPNTEPQNTVPEPMKDIELLDDGDIPV